jgi:hypothetical protein
VELMRWSNNQNLPAPLAAAIRNDSYKKVGWISATSLLQPPQKRVLEARHHNEIVTDVSENIFSLLGQVVHGILERSATSNEVPERRLIVTVRGKEVSGQADLFESLHASGGLLSDYKTVSVAAFQAGDKDSWEQQLNIYAYLFAKHGIEVKQLQIVAIFRDFSKRKARRDKDYPQSGVQLIPIPLWPLDKAEAFIDERVRLHLEAEALPDSKLPPCSDSERWMQEGVWKVYGANKDRSLRNFTGEGAEAAARALAKEKKAEAVFVAGEAIRCTDYCKAAPFCQQLKREMPEGVDMSMAAGA